MAIFKCKQCDDVVGHEDLEFHKMRHEYMNAEKFKNKMDDLFKTYNLDDIDLTKRIAIIYLEFRNYSFLGYEE